MDKLRFSILDSRFTDRSPEASRPSEQVRPRKPSSRGLQSRIENRESGFTLIEVLVAILIVSSVAIVLIYRRIDVVRDAVRVRDERVAWTLAALKLGDLSRDPASILESDSGDFEEDAADFAEFRWSYESQEEPILIDDAPSPDEQPRALRRIKLKIFDAEDVELQSIEAMFPLAPRAEENP